CDRSVDYGDFRILGFVERNQSFQSRTFIAGPPGKDLQLSLGSSSCCHGQGSTKTTQKAAVSRQNLFMLYPSILFWAFPHKRAKTPPHHLPYRLGVEYVEAEVLGCSLWLS